MFGKGNLDVKRSLKKNRHDLNSYSGFISILSNEYTCTSKGQGNESWKSDTLECWYFFSCRFTLNGEIINCNMVLISLSLLFGSRWWRYEVNIILIYNKKNCLSKRLKSWLKWNPPPPLSWKNVFYTYTYLKYYQYHSSKRYL